MSLGGVLAGRGSGVGPLVAVVDKVERGAKVVLWVLVARVACAEGAVGVGILVAGSRQGATAVIAAAVAPGAGVAAVVAASTVLASMSAVATPAAYPCYGSRYGYCYVRACCCCVRG